MTERDLWERSHITNADIYLEQYPRIWETLDRNGWVRDLVFGLRRHLIDAATERDALRAEVETLVRAAEKCTRRALHAEVKRLRAEVAEVGELEAKACMRYQRAHDQAERYRSALVEAEGSLRLLADRAYGSKDGEVERRRVLALVSVTLSDAPDASGTGGKPTPPTDKIT